MWRLSVVILVLAVGLESAPTGDENGLIQRLKRSPYCPPEYPPPPPPPPPPHFGPPHHHHHHFGGYSEANSQAISGQYQQGQNYGGGYSQANSRAESGQNYGGGYSQANSRAESGQNQFSGQGQNYQNPGQAGCDTCKGQDSAVSNAQSGTGNAVAIAVSKG